MMTSVINTQWRTTASSSDIEDGEAAAFDGGDMN
jgi:hypothetical protein